jgi:hypothetical protein
MKTLFTILLAIVTVAMMSMPAVSGTIATGFVEKAAPRIFELTSDGTDLTVSGETYHVRNTEDIRVGALVNVIENPFGEGLRVEYVYERDAINFGNGGEDNEARE